MVETPAWTAPSDRCPLSSSLRNSCARLLCSLTLLTLPAAAQQKDPATPAVPQPSLARSIAEVAVNYGLSLERPPTPGERLYLSTLLDAALELDPRLNIAHRGRFELAQLANDATARTVAIDSWYKSQPNHAGLAALWLEQESKQWHTSEQRERGLLQIISRPGTADYLKGLAYVQLARLAHERMDQKRCDDCLENSLGFMPNHPEGILTSFEWLDATASTAKRLGRALHVVRLNPMHVEAAWEAALALQEAGLPEQAAIFFDHAKAVYTAVRPQAVAPAIYHVHLAENHLARGNVEEGVQVLRTALSLDPGRIETAFLLLWAFDRAGLEASRDRLLETLSERFARLRDPSRWPVEEVLQAAWYYYSIDRQPERCLMLAKDAHARLPRNPAAQRILGYAHSINGDTDSARELLAQAAPKDAYAAIWLAVTAINENDQAIARQWLAPFWDSYPIGPMREALDAVRGKLNDSQELTEAPEVALEETLEAAVSEPVDPNAPEEAAKVSKPAYTDAQQELIHLLEGFDQQRLNFYKNPQDFIQLGVRFADPTRAPGEPWWVQIALHNRSEEPFIIGSDGAVNAVVSLTLELVGQRTLNFSNLITVTFDQTRLLNPGQTLYQWRRVDVGPVQNVLKRNPRLLIRANLSAVLDPAENQAGQWVPSVAGQVHKPVYLSRAPFVPSVESLDLLIRRVQSGEDDTLQSTLDQIAKLLGEQQRAQLDPDAPKPPPIPSSRLITALQGTLESEKTSERAAALLALDSAGLNSSLLNAVRRCLESDSWVVRLLAIRVIYRLGPSAASEMNRFAEQDPHPLVQRLAAALKARLDEKAALAKEPSSPEAAASAE